MTQLTRVILAHFLRNPQRSETKWPVKLLKATVCCLLDDFNDLNLNCFFSLQAY